MYLYPKKKKEMYLYPKPAILETFRMHKHISQSNDFITLQIASGKFLIFLREEEWKRQSLSIIVDIGLTSRTSWESLREP